MAKYFRIIISFIKFGLATVLEYRLNSIIWLVLSVFWAFLFILTSGLIMGNVGSIVGWTKEEVLLLATVNGMFSALMSFVIYPNLTEFSDLVRKGNLDFSLVKPLNSRFLISFQKFDFNPVVRILTLSFFATYLIHNLQIEVGIFTLFESIILMISGLAIFYNIYFSITALNFWFVKLFNLGDLFVNTIENGRFPNSIYQGALGLVFTYVIPLGFVGTFPVQALLGTVSPSSYIIGICLVLLTSFASQYIWNLGLKSYSSASS